MSEDRKWPVLRLGTYSISRLADVTDAEYGRSCPECKQITYAKPLLLITVNDIRVSTECANCGTDNPLLRGKVTELTCVLSNGQESI